MACERIRLPKLSIAALVAVLLLLWIPSAGHAAERDKLASAGQLARGSGYQGSGGSDAVRILQRRLRRLGAQPGPVDGLYGPLTQGAVERFQQRHGLAVDGVVGRQTMRSLFTRTSQPTASPAKRDTKPGTLERKSPAPLSGVESAEHPNASPVPAGVASRDGPAPGNGVPPAAIAALAALAGLMLLLTLRKQGEVRLNLGLTCAALLGVFGVGAVAGALFATQAAPQGTDRSTARSGLLLADGPVRQKHVRATAARSTTVAVPARRTHVRTFASHAAASKPAPASRVLALERPLAPVAPLPPAAPVTPVASPAPPPQPPARPAKPRARAQPRRPGTITPASDSSLGGGARSGDPVLLDAGGGLRVP
jgi:peptidoglycan hydrolase-like protein with peptidoglycan-binding domain